ncbi:hypothetical protein HK098_006461 [Nowakowskiella sp. JEL0407]|nr:hypothetical protein HK098_006461 [Nowakowskiella sp. JEL0407]
MSRNCPRKALSLLKPKSPVSLPIPAAASPAFSRPFSSPSCASQTCPSTFMHTRSPSAFVSSSDILLLQTPTKSLIKLPMGMGAMGVHAWFCTLDDDF